MQSTASLYDTSNSGKAAVAVPCPFAKGGTRTTFPVNGGLPVEYAMPTNEGGMLITRAITNWIGFLCTLDEFMSAIGAVRTYFKKGNQSIVYDKYALLDYIDKIGVSHPIMASASGLGDFTGHSNIGSAKWKMQDYQTLHNSGFYFT